MSIDEVEQNLNEKRRIKFGQLWTNAKKYFIEQNLYHISDTPVSSENHL